MVKLSVIVPVYNMAAGGKLEYCLKSLIGQTLPAESYEILAVDDASSDESPEILRRYAAEFPDRFTAVCCPVNHHQGGAKNAGLSLARGEWIGFIDADDWVMPDFYEKLLAAAEREGADMAGCDYCLVDRHTMECGQVVHNNRPEQAGELDAEKYRSLILDSGSLVVKIYRRELILGVRRKANFAALSAEDERAHKIAELEEDRGRLAVFPEDIFYEDNAVCKSWMLRAKRFVYLQEPMYYYLQHDASTVHNFSEKNMEDRKEAARLMLEEARRQGYFDEYRPELEYAFTVLFYGNTLFTVMRAGRGIRNRFGFTERLGREMRETFPDFQENPYYQERMDPEEKRMIRLQQRFHLAFYLYYRLLWAYRDIRAGRKRPIRNDE